MSHLTQEGEVRTGQSWPDSAPTSLAQTETEQTALSGVAQLPPPEAASSEPSYDEEEKEGYQKAFQRALSVHSPGVHTDCMLPCNCRKVFIGGISWETSQGETTPSVPPR